MLAVTDQDAAIEDQDAATPADSDEYQDSIEDVSPQPMPVWWEAHLRAA